MILKKSASPLEYIATHSLRSHDVGCKSKVKLTLHIINHYVMKQHEKTESEFPPFLTSSDVVSNKFHAPAALSLENEPLVPIG
jgi:hypothetical protein